MTLSVSAVVLALLAVAVSNEPTNDGLSATLEALRHAEFATARSAAIEKLAKRSSHTPLPATAIATLLETAQSDAYISVRFEATRLLIATTTDADLLDKLGKAWSSGLTNPDGEVWSRSLHPLSAAKVQIEVVNLLAELYEAPYPDHVIDTWIESLRSFAGDDALKLLRGVRVTQRFSERQLRHLSITGAREHRADRRDAIYALAVRPLDLDTLSEMVDAFEHARNPSDRLFAAYSVKHHFANRSVPVPLAAVAIRVMREAKDAKLRGVAAQLIAGGEMSFADREAMLLSGLRQHEHDGEIAETIVALYGRAGVHALVTRYVAEPNIPRTLRLYALQQLERSAERERSLPEATATALIRAAWTTSDYAVINGIERVLVSWGSDVPLIVHVKSSDVQSRTLFGALVLCVVVNGVAGLVSLGYILVRPFHGKRPGARKLGAALGWIALSVVMLGLAALAFIGFLGHNAPPDPRDTLKLNVPLYVGTLIYVPLAVASIKRARRSLRIPAESTVA